MNGMGRLRMLAAVMAGLALVAALPAPCGCAPKAPGHPDDAHACCVPPTGVSEADRGCCDATPAAAEAVPAPAAADSVAVVAPAPLGTLVPRRVLSRSSAFVVASPPPTVLRI
jgi:hypothetical protein